jgi:DNA-binding MarR family transcriptional regulator
MIPENREDSELNVPKSKLMLPSNQLFASSVRFSIMLILYVYQSAKFKELQKIMHISSGKLDHHIRRLEEANFIEKRNSLLGTHPSIKVVITEQGKQSFEKYLSNLKDVLDKIEIP